MPPKNCLSPCLQGYQEVYDLCFQHSAFSLDADRHDTLDAKKHDDHKEGQMWVQKRQAMFDRKLMIHVCYLIYMYILSYGALQSIDQSSSVRDVRKLFA